MYDFTMTIICADWTVGKDVEVLTSNVCDVDIIRHHVPESPGINMGSRSNEEGLMVMVEVIRKGGVARKCFC